MAIEKFKFLSPGVQINEIDQSQTPAQPAGIGPVVIGRTARGPAMQPVQVSSIAELEQVFGAPSNGNVSGIDFWRSSAPQSPTFATYAAKAYLQNASPVTVIRLLGVTDSDSVDAGWKITTADGVNGATSAGAYGLFVKGNSGNGKLAAVIYTTASLPMISSSTGYKTGSVDLSTANKITLRISASTTVVDNVVVDFNTSSGAYIRSVLNTNPTSFESAGSYFLGETFESFTGTSFTSASIVPLAGAYSDYTTANRVSETGWIVSQTGVANGSFVANASGLYPGVTNLFKFETLNGGAWESANIKISIENIKSASQPSIYPYGSFDVVVRNLRETSANSSIERFSGVNLDPNSDNYIAKVIGNAVREWDTTQRKYIEYGEFPNNSAYVRVVMSSESIDSSRLPYGFYGPKFFASGSVNSKVASTSSIGFTTVEMPQLSLVASVNTADAKTKRFGFASTSSQSDLVDILRYSPATDDASAIPSFLFTLQNISSSTSAYTYASYNYSNSLGVSDPHKLVLGFDVPLYGGFDGVNITKKEPFVNQSVLENATEVNSYAYQTIKRAIDIVADPEVIEMDTLVIPNLKKKELTGYMVDICKNRGDSVAIIDLEGDMQHPFEGGTAGKGSISSVSQVVTNLNARAIDNSFGAAYFPAVFVGSEGIYMPASIAALGAFGGTNGRSALWFAPAGFNRGGLTQLNSGIGVTRTRIHLNSSDRDALYSANINPIAQFPAEGVVIFGQKTLQTTPSALDRVNVRRLVNFIKRNIGIAANTVLFEPNVETTWDSFKSLVDPFLLAIKNGFGLDDARVVLDSRTTTADLVDRNTMYAKLYIKPTRAIEYIAIDLIITNSGVSFAGL